MNRSTPVNFKAICTLVCRLGSDEMLCFNASPPELCHAEALDRPKLGRRPDAHLCSPLFIFNCAREGKSRHGVVLFC